MHGTLVPSDLSVEFVGSIMINVRFISQDEQGIQAQGHLLS